jgi:lipid II:glycine glycyltransferase (peptidoglycan interpeptide bridge formation enzyme)
MARVDLVLPLEADEEAQWKAFSTKRRTQLRKVEREGLRIADGSPEELSGLFYQPFQVNMRDLGSPVHAERFFLATARHFGARARFIVALLDERPIGGLLAIRYADVVSVPWASTLRSERRRRPNNLIYWEALRWAVRGGARAFDFGRSPPDSGTYHFKRGWGAQEQPLAWLRLDPGGNPLDVSGIDGGPVLRRLSALWTRLPVPVSALLGPPIRRYLSN